MSHQTRDQTAPQSRQPRATGEDAVFSIGGRPISQFEFQAVLVGLYCLICLCCSVSAFIWGSTSPTQRDARSPLRRRTSPAVTVSPTAVAAPNYTTTCTPPSTPTESWTPAGTSSPEETTRSPTPAAESPLATPTPVSTAASTPGGVPQPSQTPEPTPGMPSILPTPTIPLPYTEPPPATLTVTITLSPSETPTPTPTPILSDLHIDHVERSSWDEEYVLIENRGTGSQDMTGWTLHNKTGQTYYFPAGFTLAGEARVRVWTKTGQDSNTNLYWASSTAIWDNTSDTAYLRDDTRSLVDIFSW